MGEHGSASAMELEAADRRYHEDLLSPTGASAASRLRSRWGRAAALAGAAVLVTAAVAVLGRQAGLTNAHPRPGSKSIARQVCVCAASYSRAACSCVRSCMPNRCSSPCKEARASARTHARAHQPDTLARAHAHGTHASPRATSVCAGLTPTSLPPPSPPLLPSSVSDDRR